MSVLTDIIIRDRRGELRKEEIIHEEISKHFITDNRVVLKNTYKGVEYAAIETNLMVDAYISLDKIQENTDCSIMVLLNFIAENLRPSLKCPYYISAPDSQHTMATKYYWKNQLKETKNAITICINKFTIGRTPNDEIISTNDVERACRHVIDIFEAIKTGQVNLNKGIWENEMV